MTRLKRPGQRLSLSGRFGLLMRSSADDLEPENVAPNLSASPKTVDEDEVKLFIDIELLRDMLVYSRFSMKWL
jgi:hypothetical protein